MKKFFAMALALCLVLSLTACGGSKQPDAPAAPADTIQAPDAPAPEQNGSDGISKLVYASTTAEFLDAIDDYTTIMLEPGTYDLTEWLAVNEIPEYNYEAARNPKGLINEFGQLDVNEIRGLVIASKDPLRPAEIVSQDPYSQVMSFNHCDDLVLQDIIMGHAVEPGSCSGDVLGLTNCRFVTIQGCDLYGCGTYGLCIYCSWGVDCIDSYIHDCTYGCIESWASRNIAFYNTAFADCDGYTMLDMSDTWVDFTDCSFINLYGDLLDPDERTYANFYNCYFDDFSRAQIDDYLASGAYGIWVE